MRKNATAAVLMAVLTSVASGQSLLRDQQNAPPPDASPEASQKPLQEASLIFVTAPKPKSFKKNDLITILIDEQSKASSDSDAKSKKTMSFSAALKKFPDLVSLLETRAQPSDRNPLMELDVSGKPKWEGKGNYDRTDKFSAKITATVIDVKPNGVLVLEAKKTITKDEEITTILLAGNCRTEDVTTSNTVLSSQLAELTVTSKNEGQVRDASKKGWIPRLFDTVFGF
ncbi:MAG: flagellar basal body L-ring protein FlgH [Phycisphaerales bacterium]|nr:flagellar basal body L-ring protein FlgH [Phycisphaerales bacterium]